MRRLLGRCFGTLSGKPHAEIKTRLGTRELGRHAYETNLPNWLRRLLENEEKQHLDDAPSGILDILGKLIEQDQDVETAYLCHPSVCYVGKIKVRGKSEGDHFCGYHNIQMLASYLNITETQSHGIFASGIPTIRELQSLIEEAWDQGFNESGRFQTGGIKGTRKHIGTPEAQALFASLKVPCKADKFQDVKGSAKACEQLLDSVEHYFSTSFAPSDSKNPPTVRNTRLPPIYLQRPRHSMTIIGIEKFKDGSRSLLAFDPAYSPSKGMLEMLDGSSATSYVTTSTPSIKPYRRGKKYLQRYHAFETLRLEEVS